jgi:hypothetical protein
MGLTMHYTYGAECDLNKYLCTFFYYSSITATEFERHNSCFFMWEPKVMIFHGIPYFLHTIAGYGGLN